MDGEADLLLGRYAVGSGPPVGTGGWCVVRRAADTKSGGRPVAVKAFNAQAVKELEAAALAQRFAREVALFRELGVGPPEDEPEGGKAKPQARCPWNPGGTINPRELLVNLLDFSGAGRAAGPAPDGQLYAVLELADHSLDAWLRRRRESGDFVAEPEVRDVARAVASALAWLHQHSVCHLDIKPDNILNFRGVWKLIDLEGCLRTTGGALVSRHGFTPLYASPELAAFALTGGEVGPAPDGAMDVWAAGVVLLDVLAHTAIFQETKSGFDAAALFEEEAVPFEGWYRWLADPAPVDVPSLLTAPAPSVELYRGSAELRGLLAELLDKDPARRPTASGFQGHPFLLGGGVASPGPPADGQAVGREQVEAVFKQADDAGQLCKDGCLPIAKLLALVVRLGLCDVDAQLLLNACNPSHKDPFPYSEFLEFVYRAVPAGRAQPGKA